MVTWTYLPSVGSDYQLVLAGQLPSTTEQVPLNFPIRVKQVYNLRIENAGKSTSISKYNLHIYN